MPLDPNCMEKVSVFLSARNLPNVPTFGTTDPFLCLYEISPRDGSLVKVGQTPVLKDTLNPDYAAPFLMDYMFEQTQTIVLRAYHYNPKHPATPEDKHHLLGETRLTLSQLMCTTANVMTLTLGGQGATNKPGTVQVRAEPAVNTRDLFVVTFSGQKLSNKDGFFGKSDPFLSISRMNEDGSYTIVWKSTKIDNSLNPKWSQAKLSMQTLCNGDIDRPLKIEILDWDPKGKYTSMGTIEGISVRSLCDSNGAAMNVIEKDKQAKNPKKYTNSGTLTATGCSIEHHPTFTDFIAGGMEISLMVAIDFTGSNGDPALPTSLHYINPTGQFNPYQDAIMSVGSVLNEYDTDHMIPVYGFGARCRQADGTFSVAQHAFPVYGGGLEVQGPQGVLTAYTECLKHVMLSGPTLFAPIINAVTAVVAGQNFSAANQKYNVLLMITDGVINDMDATKAAIVNASKYALSIVVVGVGAADFTEMNALDADGQLLRAGAAVAERDIVQFVAKTPDLTGALVAQQTLAEIPNQVLRFMEQRNVMPKKKA